MGIHLFSSSVHDRIVYVDRPVPTPSGNPNPWRFQVVRTQQVGDHTVAEVVYPDATSYEGRKIILYANTAPERVEGAKVLDPHFAKNKAKNVTPFARFEPTEEGWRAAVALAEAL